MWNKYKRQWPLYLMLLIPAIFVFIFSYIPMAGVILAFQNFNPAKGMMHSEFVGLKWFTTAMQMPDFGSIISNTILISIGKIILSQLFCIMFAILLNEVSSRYFMRITQTITYFPHFLSWVIIGGIFVDILSTKGIVNQAISLFGFNKIFFLGDNKWFQPTVVILEVWKEFGWGAILYLAAITTINGELYESAVIDGANRFQQAIHITIPGIMSTIILLAALSLGGILNAGLEQILVLYNPVVYRTGDILDTFVYRQGLLGAQYSLATAIGLFKSVIGMFLIIISNRLIIRYANYRIF
jgi:putative aldouronate transport system permease protein